MMIYKGDGQRADWDATGNTNGRDHAQGYIADPKLENAVNVALMLEMPLLLTGEPGTGKTQLAHSIAYKLGLGMPKGTPLIFNAKTTSTARDLFYRYDALQYFQSPKDANGRARPVEDFIEYQALGQAILLALDTERSQKHKPLEDAVLAQRPNPPVRSVVLIDEIDKAPRDLPNDILNEIETMSFTVAETGRTYHALPGHKPIVILTSNSEKNLPDAFLRRCVFYHIPFPNNEKLAQIVRARLTGTEGIDVAGAVEHFEELRELELKKLPATAELIQWMRLLQQRKIALTDTNALSATYCLLAKNREDMEQVQSRFGTADRPNSLHESMESR